MPITKTVQFQWMCVTANKKWTPSVINTTLWPTCKLQHTWSHSREDRFDTLVQILMIIINCNMYGLKRTNIKSIHYAMCFHVSKTKIDKPHSNHVKVYIQTYMYKNILCRKRKSYKHVHLTSSIQQQPSDIFRSFVW